MELFDALNEKHCSFIGKQHLFFVGTAGVEGRVNVSPKGMDSLRVVDNNTLRWLNLTGSGNETAAHVLENERMTIMLCSFEKQPLILRIYGPATIVSKGDDRWTELAKDFPEYRGARQIFELNIDLVQTSCGYAIPYYDYLGERDTLNKWVDKKTDSELEEYRQQKNSKSLDGKATDI